MKRIATNIARLIKQNPLFTTINIIGLIIGFVCVIFIACWIKNELSYDKFHQKSDNIYRVHRYFFDANGTENLHLPYIAPPIAPLLKDEFPDIEKISRVRHQEMLFSLDDKKIVEPDVCFAEPDILNIFTFDGLPSKVDLITEPLTAIISESIAQKYFKNKHPVGNTLEFFDDNGKSYKLLVTGTFKTWAQNSHFHPEIFVSFSTYEHAVSINELKDWSSNNYETFALMKHPSKDLDARLDAFVNKYLDNGTRWTKIRMEKLSAIHFNWYGNRSYLYILSSVALLILLLGSINYMNLNTAIYSKRIKEIQIKKIFGATSQRIAFMLMLESVFFCIIALVIALFIVSLTLPKFGQIFNSPISFHFNESVDLIVGFVLLSIFIGLLSGLYPVFFTLSNKMSVLGNLQNSIAEKMSFRNSLVVFQFFISITLIMSFLTINKQLGFLRNKNLGFNQEYIITLNAAPNLLEKLDVFRHELTQNPNILSVSGSKRVPSQSLADSNEAKVVNNGNMEPLGFRLANVRIDEYFIPTYEIKVIAGNNITNQNKGEIEYMINYSAVEKIGWKTAEAALGQFIEYGGYKGKVVGVVEDFHYESLHNTISPIIMYFDPSDFDRVSIRISPSNLSNTVAFIEKTWQNFNLTGSPFSYQFIDERYGGLYRSEENTRQIFSYFMILAIFIAVLGLFGLSLFVLGQRTKEIGVRRVNGGNISEVMIQLNIDFVKWVVLAFLIALPVSYYAMHRWLENFAYKTELSWWIFALAGFLSLIIAILTVIWQSWRAAIRNPVEALRYE